METPIDGRRRARQLRAQGKAAAEIADELGEPLSDVCEVLRGTRRLQPAILGAGATLVEPHKPRVPRVTLDRQALPFAAGLIDRTELLRRISK
jgi:hypothetical protein